MLQKEVRAMIKLNDIKKTSVVVFAVLAFMLVSIFAAMPNKAYADDDQLSLTVPTQFPCVLLGDGTIVEPDWVVANPTAKAASVSAINVSYDYLNSNGIDGSLLFGEGGSVERTINMNTGASKTSAQLSKTLEGNKTKSFDIDVELDATNMNRYVLYTDATLSPVAICDISMTYTMPISGTFSISGNKTSGSVISSNLSGFPADATPQYQWYKDGVAISGANATTYTVQVGDIGSSITCKVTDSSGKYVGQVVSNGVGKIQAVVVFKNWDGTVLKTQNVEKGSAATAPSNPTRTGYTFTGWSPSSFANISTNTNIVAQFKINTYTVTFQTNGGSAINSQTVNYGGKATKPSSNPTYTDHTFLGYFSDAACTTAYNWNSTITKNTIVYVNWKRTYYRIHNPWATAGFDIYHYCVNTERQFLLSIGWEDNGYAFEVSVASSIPVRRFYNEKKGVEVNSACHKWQKSITPISTDWTLEYESDFGSSESTSKDYPVYEVVKNGCYAYPTKNQLSSYTSSGWTNNGIAFYAYKY